MVSREVGYLGISLLGSASIGYGAYNLFVASHPHEALAFGIIPIATAAIVYAADHSETVYKIARWLAKDRSW